MQILELTEAVYTVTFKPLEETQNTFYDLTELETTVYHLFPEKKIIHTTIEYLSFPIDSNIMEKSLYPPACTCVL